MKKVKLNSKLSLNKETIANLNNDDLNNIKGGADNSQKSDCCGYTKTEICCAISWQNSKCGYSCVSCND